MFETYVNIKSHLLRKLKTYSCDSFVALISPPPHGGILLISRLGELYFGLYQYQDYYKNPAEI